MWGYLENEGLPEHSLAISELKANIRAEFIALPAEILEKIKQNAGKQTHFVVPIKHMCICAMCI